MTPYQLDAQLSVALADNVLVLSGELSAGNAPLLLRWLEVPRAISRLELAELEIADGVAATHAVNAVRLLLSRAGGLVIEAAPQLLAHNLYRIGMLGHAGLVLVSTREEEAYG